MRRRWLLLWLLGVVLAGSAHAANDLLWVEGANVRYGDADMSPASDVQITLSSLPAGEGRISAMRDWGASPRPARFRYQCQFAVVGTTEMGKEIELYAVRSYDGTLVDARLGLIDAALTGVGDRYNLLPIGLVRVDTSQANQQFIGSGFTTEIPWRYWSLAVWNATAQALSVKGTKASYCVFTPMYLRVVP